MEVLHHWRPTFNHFWVKLIGKKKFTVAALDPEYQVFVVYVATLSVVDSGDKVHPLQRAQIAHL